MLPVGGFLRGIVKQTDANRLVVLVLLALDGVVRADEAFQPQTFEILGEETGKVGPLRGVARQENGLVAKGVRVILQVGAE